MSWVIDQLACSEVTIPALDKRTNGPVNAHLRTGIFNLS